LEIILCYPGLQAVWAHRISHWLWIHRARLAARFLAELTRKWTGVEIHPGAVLGSGVFIDHATGVVIGETAEVGDNVTIYHGVTLGGTSLDRIKRHPTVGDDVTIGAGAKVLGAITIGAGSQIGANSVVVKSVPAGAVVVGVPGQTVNRTQANGTTDDARMPDPLGISLQSLLTRVTRLETAGNGQTAERVIRPPEAGVWHGEDFSI
jgi:serine O-acetyltransferase